MQNKKIYSNPLIFWMGLFFVNLILRVSTFYTPILDIDETQFAGFAHVLLDGGLPYLNSLDTKPLGIYLFYALCFKLFGPTNMIAVHVITALVMFASSYFLYKIFAIFDRKREGRWAAVFLILFSTTFIPKYLATSINSIMIFFLITSITCIALAETRKKLKFDFLAGLLLGTAFIFKYTAGIQLVIYFLYTLIICLTVGVGCSDPDLENSGYANSGRRTRPLRCFFVRNTLFTIAFLTPFTIHGLILYKLGVWSEFLQWSLKGSSDYISQGGSTISFWQSFVIRFGTYFAATLFLWIYALKGLKKYFFKNQLHILLFIWFVLSIIPVCIGGRFYPHYFLHLLPALSGLAAIGFCIITKKTNSLVRKSMVIFLLIVPTLGFWILRLDHQKYLSCFPDDEIYEQQKIGLALKKISKPNDKIFVWGFATGIYFHSDRKPVSRFLWTDLLTGRTPGPSYARKNQDQEYEYKNPVAWQEFWQDLKEQEPDFFIDTSPANIHDYKRFPLTNYQELHSYLTENFDKVDNVLGVDIYKRKDN